MGKEAKEKKAYENAKRIRETLIGRLNKCKSEAEMSNYLKAYEDNKRKQTSSVTLTNFHKQNIDDLDLQIKGLIQNLNERFRPKDPVEASGGLQSSIQENKEVLTQVIHTIDDEKKEVGTHTQGNNEDQKSIHLPPRREGGKKPLLNESMDSSTKSSTEEYLNPRQEENESADNHRRSSPGEDEDALQAIRKRTSDLMEVFLKLRTIRFKQLKYEEKAKKYHLRGDHNKEAQYSEAASAAGSIYKQIDGLAQQYILDGNLALFQLNSTRILDEESEQVKTLKKHRGWWEEFLDSFVELINTGLARIGSSIRIHELSMFKPAADGGKKVAELTQAINSVPAI
ncbi:hypothetical protein [Fluoribacter dumoffii]|uniref:hypothetical protein n=1 Tax=Fluoribacter dumoffii TaxID=463 RepID=UPI00026C7702|nr:hypothetical protein [Fluoribacter dumoffii]